MFPPRIRGRTIALVSVVKSLCGSAAMESFPPLLQALGGVGVFALLAAGCLLSLALVVGVVVETKGRSPEQIRDAIEARLAAYGFTPPHRTSSLAASLPPNYDATAERAKLAAVMPASAFSPSEDAREGARATQPRIGVREGGEWGGDHEGDAEVEVLA